MIDLAQAGDPATLKLLQRHPRVLKAEASTSPGIQFLQGSWHRRVEIGQPEIAVSGLVELMDNNPLVCADCASVPGPVATLALIALGPLLRAGLLVSEPTMLVNADGSRENVDGFLSRSGWQDGMVLATEEAQLGSVIAAAVMAEVKTPADLSEIDDLYDEAYGPSFYVRRQDELNWDTQLVSGQPFATYRLRITPGDGTSLLTIQVMADKDGKCGAAQTVHAMNVMAGFEESLGIG